jgi:hypothetical protein
MTFAPYTIQDNERLSLAVTRVHKVQSSLALDLVQRSKTLPKGAATFVADCLARDSYMLTQHNRDEVTAELLGIEPAAVRHANTDALAAQRRCHFGQQPALPIAVTNHVDGFGGSHNDGITWLRE